jgi:hypothetical protein
MDVASTSGDVEQEKRWRLRLPERLPNLKGKWLTLYTIIWAIMLPLALVGAARAAYIMLTTPTMWGPYGLHTTEDPEGIRVAAVMSPAARAAGVAPGDHIVAVDDWIVPRVAARAAARPHVVKPDEAATIFSVRKPDGRINKVELRRNRAWEEQFYREAGVPRSFARANALLGGAVLLPAFFIWAAILLFVRRRREAVPALLSPAFLIFATIVSAGDQQGFGLVVLDTLAAVGTLFLYTALFAFPSGRFEPRWTALPALLLPIAILLDYPPMIKFIIGAVFTLLCLAALVSRYQGVGAGTERLQLRWAFFGLVAGMILTILSIAGDAAVAAWQATDPRWVIWGYAVVAPLGTWGIGVMALGLIVSILRYRLYDADALIGRSAALGVLTVGFVALFAASQKIIELLGEEYLGQNLGALAGGIGAALAAVAIAPMHTKVQRWAERRFQKALYRLRYGLPALVGDLRETAGPEQVAGATLDSVVEGLRTSRAALIVGGQLVDARDIAPDEVRAWCAEWQPTPRDGTDWDRADALFPVRIPLEAEGHGRVGWLLLGPRPDGSLFGKAERETIEEVAEPVARAVQVSVSRAEREAKLEFRLSALEGAVAKLTKKAGNPRAKPAAA